ncbi:MAG: bacteriohemerythrin [Nitrosomonadales bacterium]|nr:bacteriohemerythrin [Nitrosomonadales bacterium]
MAFLEWSRELEFGIPVIDNQHKRIVAFINELNDACQTGNAAETQHVMEGLLNYTVTHFEFEEDLQEKSGYPFLKAHRRIHEIFMKKVAAIRERSQQGEDIAPELLSLLKGWLANHIKSEDRDYVESVKTVVESSDQEVSGWLNTTIKKFFG